MKKISKVIILVSIILMSCSFQPNESSVTVQTSTPDPCSPDHVLEEVKKIQGIVNEFQDVTYIANYTPQTQLIEPILVLLGIRRDLQAMTVPQCESTLKSAVLDYMNSVIDYLAFFMGGEITENVNSSIQASQDKWDLVKNEYGKLADINVLPLYDLPIVGTMMPQTPVNAMLVQNSGTQRVNVRDNPSTEGAIVTTLEPGMQATGLARNESMDWILINLNGYTGWVFAEAVITNMPVDQLPISSMD